jgi:hypothetical protein
VKRLKVLAERLLEALAWPFDAVIGAAGVGYIDLIILWIIMMACSSGFYYHYCYPG